MTKRKVFLSVTASKQLNALPLGVKKRLNVSLRALGIDPFKSRSGVDVKKLVGSGKPALYRLRVGDYRAVYAVLDNKVMVTCVLKRGNAYGFLD